VVINKASSELYSSFLVRFFEFGKRFQQRCYFIGRDYGLYHEYFDFVPTVYVIDWSYVG